MRSTARYIINRIFMIILVPVAAFSIVGACAFFAPQTYQSLVKGVQSTGLSTYIWVMGMTGNTALKVTTYEADVTATASVNRDMGVLSLAYGEGAQVTGTIRIAMGADLKNNTFGILSCDIDTKTLQTTEGHAPLASTAFNTDEIKQAAFQAFKHEAAKQAIEQFWPTARQRLKDQFASWALGMSPPEQPTLTECPVTGTGPTPQASPTPPS